MTEEEKQQEKCDFLIWVGGSFYNTIDEYVLESAVQGACRRIPQYIDGMVKGQSRIYLAHQQHAAIMTDTFPASVGLPANVVKQALTFARKLKRGQIRPDQIPEKFGPYMGQALAFANTQDKRRVIFAFYVIEQVEFLFDGEIPDKVQELIDEGKLEPVPKEIWSGEAKRKCGYRKVGQYVTAYRAIEDSDLLEMEIDGSKVEVHGPLVVFKQPIEIEAVAPDRVPNRGVTRLADKESTLLAFEAALGGIKEAI